MPASNGTPWRKAGQHGAQKGRVFYIGQEVFENTSIDPRRPVEFRARGNGTDRGQIILELRQGRRKR